MKNDIKKGYEYRDLIESIKARFLRGEITYEEGKELVAPLLKGMNEKGAKVAKKFGRVYRELGVRSVFK